MTFRVHGSVFSDQNLTGSLRYFVIEGQSFLNYVAPEGGKEVTYPLGFQKDQEGSQTVFFDQGQPIPQSAAEMVYEAISNKATVTQFHVCKHGRLHFSLENNSAGWLQQINWDTKGGVPEDQTVVDYGDGTTGEAVGTIKKILEDTQSRFIESRKQMGIDNITTVGVDSVNKNQQVNGITINDNGSGFVVGDKLEISSPIDSSNATGFDAEVSAIRDGSVTSVSIDTAGTNYVEGDPIESSGGSGSGFSGYVASTGGSGEVTGVTIVDGGSGYSNGDSLVAGSIASGSGFDGSVNATADGVVDSITITDRGSSYTAHDSLPSTGQTYDPPSIGNAWRLRFADNGKRLFAVNYSYSLYEYVLEKPYDLSNVVETGRSLDISTQTPVTPQSVFQSLEFNDDGTKAYIGGFTEGKIWQMSFGTPWDVSTLTYDGVEFDVTSIFPPQEQLFSFLTHISIEDNGQRLFVVTDNRKIAEYTLTTPWDLSTAKFSGRHVDPTIQGIYALDFLNNGHTLVFVSGNEVVFMFELPRAYDIETMQYISTIDISGTLGSGGGGADFSKDGKKLLVHDYDGDILREMAFNNDTVTEASSASGTGFDASVVNVNYSTDSVDFSKINIIEVPFELNPRSPDAIQSGNDSGFKVL